MAKANRDQHCRKRNCRGARLMSKLHRLTDDRVMGLIMENKPKEARK
jgi:hypothetical protein